MSTARPAAHDAPIHSDEAGPVDGTFVALIHGSMDRSTGMLKLSRHLDDDCRVLRYDRRGYGRSAPHDGPFTIDAQVADLVDLLAGRPAVIVGHSYGGNVALATAVRHPELVRGVAIYETPFSWMPWWPKHTAGGQAVAQGDDPEAAAEAFMRRLIGSDRWDSLPERTRATRRAEGASMVGELADIRAHEPWSPEQISVPFIAGHGTQAREHHMHAMAWIADQIDGGQLVVLDGCAHDAPLSHPALFAHEIVRPLLARVEQADRSR